MLKLSVIPVLLLAFYIKSSSSQAMLGAEREAQLIHQYFGTLDYKNPPLYLCNSDPNVHGVAYRLPKAMECPLVDLSSPSSIVSLTLWIESLTYHLLSAYHCYAERTFYRKSYFLTFSWNEFTKTTPEPVSYDDCMQMINSQTTKKGEKMYSLADNVFGTNLVSNLQYYWGSTQEDVIINHWYARIKITVNTWDDTIVTPVQLKTMCHVTMNECATMVNGILVFRNDEY